MITRGKADGALLAAGGGRPAHLLSGYFIQPTLVGNVDNNSTIALEIFGLVLSVIPARDEAHAIALTNDSIYDLNSTVFTNDPERARLVGHQLRAGTVGHNAFHTDFSISFAGFKQSGIGRESGVKGLNPYLEAKAMTWHRHLP